MVTTLLRPASAAEARAMLDATPGSLALAGGTFLLASQFRRQPQVLVALDGLLPAGVSRTGAAIEIGAATTFQELLDSPACPLVLRQAAATMANRNIRNRATVGGNIGAGKSCASLVPALLVSEATLVLVGGRLAGLADWLEAPTGLIERVLFDDVPGWSSATRRWSRSACDIGLLSAAVALRLEGGRVADIRLACGGLGPHPRRFPAMEAALRGLVLPGAAADQPAANQPIADHLAADQLAATGLIQARVAPLIEARADLRGSAEFKRVRAAALIAEALLAAAAAPAAGPTGTEAVP